MGGRHAVEHALQATRAAAAQYHVSLNEDETSVSNKYTFAGVVFDHCSGTVSVGEKTHAKICAATTENLTLEQLERLLGRLWFAARVLLLPIHQYWFLLKAARRLFAKWSRGVLDGSTLAALPRSAQRELDMWHSAAAANQPRPVVRLPVASTEYDLYTDATLGGWGAVCIDRHSKRTVVTGSRWGADAAHNINAAELRAIRCAFFFFGHFLETGAVVHLHVDKTSALSAYHKGYARSHALNAELHETLTHLPYRVTARYIRSLENPADGPSRDPTYQTTRGRTSDTGKGET